LPNAIHENEELKTEKSAEEDVRMLASFLAEWLNKKKEIMENVKFLVET